MVLFSVVMPIHDEEDLLPYSLPSIYRLEPNEIILLFDRCTDKSLETAERIAKQYNFRSQTRLIKINKPSPKWKFRIAYLRRYGFKLAKNPIILNTDADIILDEKISDYMHLLNKNNTGMVAFSFNNYPQSFRSIIGDLVSHFAPIGFGFGTCAAFLKSAWIKTENQETVKQVPRCEDTHLVTSISKKFETIFLKTNSINLRPRETKRLHFLKGVNRWRQKRLPLWMVAIHSFIYLRPLVLSGYLRARFNDSYIK